MDQPALKTMSVPEAGKLLGVAKNAAYAAAARGEIPVIKIGRKLRVPVAALERMLIEAPSARPPPRPEPENVRRVAEQQHR